MNTKYLFSAGAALALAAFCGCNKTPAVVPAMNYAAPYVSQPVAAAGFAAPGDTVYEGTAVQFSVAMHCAGGYALGNALKNGAAFAPQTYALNGTGLFTAQYADTLKNAGSTCNYKFSVTDKQGRNATCTMQLFVKAKPGPPPAGGYPCKVKTYSDTGGAVTYTYNPGLTQILSMATSGAHPSVTAYNYGQPGQIIYTSTAGNTTAVTTATLDASGRIITESSGAVTRAFTYNFSGYLVNETVYNGAGASESTTYTWQGGNLVQYTAGGQTATYTYGNTPDKTGVVAAYRRHAGPFNLYGNTNAALAVSEAKQGKTYMLSAVNNAQGYSTVLTSYLLNTASVNTQITYACK